MGFLHPGQFVMGTAILPPHWGQNFWSSSPPLPHLVHLGLGFLRSITALYPALPETTFENAS